jgi:hypothetical protein
MNPLIHNLICLDLSCHGLTIGGITLPQSQSGIEKRKKGEREIFSTHSFRFSQIADFSFYLSLLRN